ncbi:NADH:ubiquinone oxidoreductase, NDUFA9/39kDa subunit [Phaffia rhodozyma]|uniref:NADH:ubiquinone oxidoreductase, NDUFA9/39kDa subunit n=1 Tax=Phaffia rhodozyma TaxID=264483 RepID=A0A0F7SUH9_PHARH|nr:NADH:ubiquinone oxidoreductase, NDUFA9/39kDa subunit [Phaffia rhodozyma]
MAHLRSLAAAPLGRSAIPFKPISLSQRGIFDVIVKKNSGKPIIRYGTGGRSSVSGHTATVFGASGFLGRYVVSKLAKAGTQVIVPYRDADEVRFLRVTGDLGQIVPMEWDIRKPHQIEECLRHSDVVYNLVGRDWETRNNKFDDIFATGPGEIARIAKENNVDRFIHVSHLNADLNSPSSFYRAKAKGELLVREAFPDATIVRPSGVFGFEDRLLNQAARWPFLWCQNGGKTQIRPVHFTNLSHALVNLMDADHSSPGLTLSLPGPKTYTNGQLLETIRTFTLKNPSLLEVSLPKAPLQFVAGITNRVLWWPFMDRDKIERAYINDLTDADIRIAKQGLSAADSWRVCGFELDQLDTIEEHAIKYLRIYRPYDRVVEPSTVGSVYKNQKNKAYKVIE